MASTGDRVYSTKKKNSRFYVAWQQVSQNIEGNYTDIKWQVGLRIDQWDEWYSNAVRLDYAYIDGEKVAGSITKSNLYGASTAKDFEFANGTKRIYHNSEGKKTFSVSVNGWLYSFGTVGEGSNNFTLTDIPRKATISSAPNFTDDQNPTITYSNPLGTAATALEACIASTDGTVIYVPYRDISKTGTSYTFTLTDTERNTLRNATKTSNTFPVKFYVQTKIGETYYRSSVEKTLTIANPNPTLNPTVVDSNATTKALTGDANKLIKYYSNAAYTIGAAAVKGASITSQKATHNGKTLTTATGTFNAVENGAFTFEVTDSRGNKVPKSITKTFINYIKTSCNLDTSILVTGVATLKISGNYFNGSFGAQSNSLTIQYRYKTSSGSYGEWLTAAKTVSGNKYDSTVTVSGLDYRETYTFQARATDKLSTASSAEETKRALPVFDWGEEDFKFNVDVFDKNSNKLGTEITAANQTAVSLSGKELKESGWVSITPVANTPTSASVKFKKTYSKLPTVVMSVASSVPGTQVLGFGQSGISTTGVNIYVTRTNTVATVIYYFVFGEASE